jgi:hypothetical protein
LAGFLAPRKTKYLLLKKQLDVLGQGRGKVRGLYRLSQFANSGLIARRAYWFISAQARGENRPPS